MSNYEEKLNSLYKKVFMWSVGIIIPLSVVFGSMYTVDEGHVGIVKRLGEAKSQQGPGFHFKAPFIDDIVEMEVRTRKNSEKMVAATSEQMKVVTTTSINWTVTKSAAIDLYRQYGGLDQFEQRILDPRLRSASKSGISKFKAEELIQNRGLAISKIEELLKKEVVGLPIQLGDVQIENIQLPAKYTQSIETKQTEKNLADAEKHKLARQALLAQQQVNTALAVRDSTKARADGDAYKIEAEAKAIAYSIKAKGEAEAGAIKAKAKAIASNATLVEYTRARRWNGQMPSTIMGGDQSVLWSMK